MRVDLTQFLAPEAAALWQRYLSAEAEGKRGEALTLLQTFLTHFSEGSEEQRRRFAEAFCRLMAEDGQTLPLRQPLFAEALGPYLVSAYQSGEDIAHWLAYFQPQFWKMPPPQRFDGLPHLSPIELLQEKYLRDPDHIPTQEMLIQKFAQQFEYAVHDVPSGVLYGADGASVGECREWEQDLELFRDLVQKRGIEGQYKETIQHWQYHFHGYADYLLNRSQYETYADYLRLHADS